ncbi:MAG: tripartite tricarboxylate transporter substrate binding protein [Acidobacteria bacterium]|nr:tripartite tricarboxylate transporter substrate binding protein [Acidobacteriota bacterium]
MLLPRRVNRSWTLALLAMFVAMPACRQGEYPGREIELIIPFPPGGPADTATRIIQPRLSEILGVPVILVNKPGGGGSLGTDFVAKAKPDGYQLLATSNNSLTILPAMQPDLTYQPTDFASIGTFMVDINVITVRTNQPWKTLEELVDYARKNPGKLNYGSGGVGTNSYFLIEMFKLAFGLDIAHVPFQGTGPLKNALLGGHVDFGGGGIASLGPLIESGDILPIVTTASQRLPGFPNVPTTAEKGFPEASLNAWIGLFVPAETPKAIVDKLSEALSNTMQDPAVIVAVEKSGLLVDYRAPQDTRMLVETEHETVKKAIEKLGTLQ